jgi:hypothetical protein
MPKLDADQILDRLEEKLRRVEAGEELPNKDVRALLTPEQLQKLDQAQAHQDQLRKTNRPRTEQEKTELGWKTKRQVRIDVYKEAIKEADKNLLVEMQKQLHQAEIKQARIYLDNYFAARKAGKEKYQAENEANSALTRAHLRRIDSGDYSMKVPRDIEVKDGEEKLRAYLRTQMTKEELEQLELLEEHKKALKGGGANERRRSGKARK